MRALLLLPFLLLGACKSDGEKEAEQKMPRKASPLASELPQGDLVQTSRDATFMGMLAELADADVVYVGETHTNPDHHLIQLRVIEYLAANGRLHAIGMEMFQRTFQGALDDYVFGQIDEEELLTRTDYKKRWGYPFELYRPILEFARKKRIPVRALNVENEIRKAARKGGLDAVSEEWRRTLPAIDTKGFPDHRAYVRKVYDDHKQFIKNYGEADFENFYIVQCLWEEVMADSIVQWFRTAPDGGQIVVLAGSGHVANRYGIPARAHERNGKSYKVVVPLMAGEKGPGRDVHAQDYADFVWVTPVKQK